MPAPMPATGLSRVLLVADQPPARPAGVGSGAREARIRRYRLARLELESREARFAHLRRMHD